MKNRFTQSLVMPLRIFAVGALVVPLAAIDSTTHSLETDTKSELMHVSVSGKQARLRAADTTSVLRDAIHEFDAAGTSKKFSNGSGQSVILAQLSTTSTKATAPVWPPAKSKPVKLQKVVTDKPEQEPKSETAIAQRKKPKVDLPSGWTPYGNNADAEPTFTKPTFVISSEEPEDSDNPAPDKQENSKNSKISKPADNVQSDKKSLPLSVGSSSVPLLDQAPLYRKGQQSKGSAPASKAYVTVPVTAQQAKLGIKGPLLPRETVEPKITLKIVPPPKEESAGKKPKPATTENAGKPIAATKPSGTSAFTTKILPPPKPIAASAPPQSTSKTSRMHDMAKVLGTPKKTIDKAEKPAATAPAHKPQLDALLAKAKKTGSSGTDPSAAAANAAKLSGLAAKIANLESGDKEPAASKDPAKNDQRVAKVKVQKKPPTTVASPTKVSGNVQKVSALQESVPTADKLKTPPPAPKVIALPSAKPKNTATSKTLKPAAKKVSAKKKTADPSPMAQNRKPQSLAALPSKPAAPAPRRKEPISAPPEATKKASKNSTAPDAQQVAALARDKKSVANKVAKTTASTTQKPSTAIPEGKQDLIQKSTTSVVRLPSSSAKTNSHRTAEELAGPEGIAFIKTDGKRKIILSTKIWRLRKSMAYDEPYGTWVIYHEGGRFFASGEQGQLLSRIKKKVDLRTFTTPHGENVYLAPAKVETVLDAVGGKHHDKAASVIVTKWGTQQVREQTYAVNNAISDTKVR